MYTTNFLILLFLSTTTTLTLAHGPYIPSGSGSLPHYPIPTGTGILPHPPYPTGTGINPGGPIESATTCPLPSTVTVTTDVTVTVTVPPSGVASASVSAGLKRRMDGRERGGLEMRGLADGERERERKKRG